MSYEKVKNIARKPKEGKIYITSACNNCRPITYSRWEFMAKEQDYHKKELELMRGINGGGLVLNDSCYNWNYAYYKTREVMQDRYENYDLYSLSSMKHTHYCLGEQISSQYTPITREEVESGNYDYILDWESKDGASKVYYRAEEYKAEEERVKAVLEEYFEVFNGYLEEQHDGEYYLYSESYGYVKPKGTTGSFYYSRYADTIEIMDYKKAYCIAKNIGRDVEVKEVPKRTYKPTKEQLEEGKSRLKDIIGFDSKYAEKLYLSDRYCIREIGAKELDLMKAINEFENEYQCFVYHIIFTSSNFGYLFSMLYVSNHEEEWQEDRKLLQANESYAYVWNKDDEVLSEIGLIGIEKNGNYLKRNF